MEALPFLGNEARIIIKRANLYAYITSSFLQNELNNKWTVHND